MVVLLSFYWIKVSQLRFMFVLYIYIYVYKFQFNLKKVLYAEQYACSDVDVWLIRYLTQSFTYTV